MPPNGTGVSRRVPLRDEGGKSVRNRPRPPYGWRMRIAEESSLPLSSASMPCFAAKVSARRRERHAGGMPYCGRVIHTALR